MNKEAVKMMNGIKHAISFVAGAVYSWAVIYSLTHPVEGGSSFVILPALIISLIGGVLIIGCVLAFLAENWNKE
jgi:hypothetical protein